MQKCSLVYLKAFEMDRENRNPEREKYLQQLRALERSLRERVQQEEQEVQQLRDEAAEAEAELAEHERVAAEAERVRAARRAYIQELQKRKNYANKQ